MKVPHLCLSPLSVLIDACPLVKDGERQPHQDTTFIEDLDEARAIKSERTVIMTYLTKINHFS